MFNCLTECHWTCSCMWGTLINVAISLSNDLDINQCLDNVKHLLIDLINGVRSERVKAFSINQYCYLFNLTFTKTGVLLLPEKYLN